MFYLYMKQSGQGCDYTIGCGHQLLALKAGTIEEAKVEVAKIFEDYGCINNPDDRDLDHATIFSDGVDVLPILHKMQEEEGVRQVEAAAAEKRKQLEKISRDLDDLERQLKAHG